MSAAAFVKAHGGGEGELAQEDVCALFHSLAALEKSSVRRAREARAALDAVASGARRERRAAEAKVQRRGARLQRILQARDAMGALQLCFLRANCRIAHSAHPLAHMVVQQYVFSEGRDRALAVRMLDSAIGAGGAGEVIASLAVTVQIGKDALHAAHARRICALAAAVNEAAPRALVVTLGSLAKALCLLSPKQLAGDARLARLLAALRALLATENLCWQLGGGLRITASELVAKAVYDFGASAKESSVLRTGARDVLPRILSAPALLVEIARFATSASAPCRVAALAALAAKVAILEEAEDTVDDAVEEAEEGVEDGAAGDEEAGAEGAGASAGASAARSAAALSSSAQLSLFVRGATDIASVASARDPAATVRKAAVDLLSVLVSTHEATVACGVGGEAAEASAALTMATTPPVSAREHAAELRSRGVALRIFDCSVSVRRAAIKAVRAIGWPTLVLRISSLGVADLFVRFASVCSAPRREHAGDGGSDGVARADADGAAGASAESLESMDELLLLMLLAWRDAGAAPALSAQRARAATSAELVQHRCVAAMLRRESQQSELLSGAFLRRNGRRVAELMKEEKKEEEEEGREATTSEEEEL